MDTKPTKKKKLRLYVWENVLTDYTSGVMFALAYSADHARKILLKERNYESVIEDLKKEPLVVTRPQGFLVCGGG